jgi:hypothetical protein
MGGGKIPWQENMQYLTGIDDIYRTLHVVVHFGSFSLNLSSYIGQASVNASTTDAMIWFSWMRIWILEQEN